MPKGIGYPEKKKQEPFRPTMGVPSRAVQLKNAAATKRQREEFERLAERKRVNAWMARGKIAPQKPSVGRRAPQKPSAGKQVPQKPTKTQESVRGESATRGIGLGSLFDALSPQQKKKGRR